MPGVNGESGGVARLLTRRLWKGEKPTAEELLSEMRSPFQLEYYWTQLEPHQVVVPLSPKFILTTWVPRKKQKTADEIVAAAGVSADEFRLFKIALDQHVSSLGDIGGTEET